MASTWTTNNAIEKIADGEKTDTWGQITNRNFDIIDRTMNGVGTIDLSSSGAAHTLSTTDGTVGDSLTDGMYKVLVLDGATEACTITISPNDAQKLYFVVNSSGYDCTFTQGTGGNITVANSATKILYADGAGAGAAVAEIADDLAILNVTTLGTSEASKVVTADASGDIILSNDVTISGAATITGAATFDGKIVEENTAITSSSLLATIDLNDGTNFTHTLTENVTYTFSNPAASGNVSAFTLKVVQDTTSRTITWPSSVDWPSGNAPTLSTSSGAVDVFVFITYDGGSTYYGFAAGQAMG